MLNRIILAVFFICQFISITAQKDSDVLMTVGDQDVTVGEFRYIYEKNNGKTADYSAKSLNEYVDLYTKFKLKVAKAKEMKLDTIVSLQQELAGYRKQLANSFLTDREVNDKLIQEIEERKKTDVLVRHILVNVKPRSTAERKERAKKKLSNYRQQIKEGNSFEDIAKKYSEDRNTKANGGSLGYITALLPNGFYELENAMYNLKVGEISDIIQTKLGYHLVLVEDRRPARGKVEVAQIFKKVDEKLKDDPAGIKAQMDSIYNALQNGADFETLVSKYSEDKTTLKKGGKLPAFGIGVYDKVFENAAFSLASDGDISKPIRTSVGYHILKRISKPQPKGFSDLKIEYKEKLRKYDRYGAAQELMVTKIKDGSKFTERRAVLDKFIQSVDKSFYSYKWKPAADLGNEMILSFGPDYKETLSDFAKFAKSQTRLRSQYEKSTPLDFAVGEIYDAFVKEKAFQFEQANLESKYSEFRSLMREYEEGILLFEATKINVWDKANTDTVGLYTFYETNKSKYMFEEQATIGKYIINTTDSKTLKKVKKCIKKRDAQKTLARFNKEKELIEYNEITVEPGSKELIGVQFKKKSTSDPIVDKKSKKSLIKKVIKISPPRRKTLKEARGYVVADYQDQLENKWVNQLKKTYPVQINKEIFNSLLKK